MNSITELYRLAFFDYSFLKYEPVLEHLTSASKMGIYEDVMPTTTGHVCIRCLLF